MEGKDEHVDVQRLEKKDEKAGDGGGGFKRKARRERSFQGLNPATLKDDNENVNLAQESGNSPLPDESKHRRRPRNVEGDGDDKGNPQDSGKTSGWLGNSGRVGLERRQPDEEPLTYVICYQHH
jgi:hypothetical protein